MFKTEVTTPGGDRSLPYSTLRNVIPWVVFAGLPLLLGSYLVWADQGATALISNAYIHEFAHGGSHSLGLSCH